MKKILQIQFLGCILLASMFAVGCNSDVAVEEPETQAEVVEKQQDEPEPTATPVPPTATPEPAVSLGERIEVQASGFSVQPPADYIVDLSDPEGVQMFASEEAEENGPGIAIFGGEFGDEMTADQMYEFIIEADEMMQNVVRSPATMEGADGFVADFEGEEQGVKFKGRIILNLIDGQGTMITAGAPADAWDSEFEELVEAVSASVELFDIVNE